MEINQRILELIKALEITNQKFAESININPSNIAHITSGRSKPSYPMIFSILEKYPEVSPDWLILDKGDMYRDNVDGTVSGEVEKTPFPMDLIDFSDNLSSVDNQTVQSEDLDSNVVPNHSLSPLSDNEQTNVNIESESIEKCFENKEIRSIKKVILLYNDGSFEEFNQ